MSDITKLSSYLRKLTPEETVELQHILNSFYDAGYNDGYSHGCDVTENYYDDIGDEDEFFYL